LSRNFTSKLYKKPLIIKGLERARLMKNRGKRLCLSALYKDRETFETDIERLSPVVT